MFYFNPEDVSVFLPKRFGVGWTLNLARPSAWAIVVGIVILTVTFIVLVANLTG